VVPRANGRRQFGVQHSACLRLRGRLDVEACSALTQIVARHETLRSRFVSVDDQAQVTIAPVDSGLLLQVEDLRQDPQAEATVQALLAQEAATAFDLQHDPLIRGRLVRLADEHHVLLLTVHHIIADGWSMGVLTRELMALYQASVTGNRIRCRWRCNTATTRCGSGAGSAVTCCGRAITGSRPRRRAGVADLPPTVRVRQQDFAGSSVEVRLDERLSAGLKALSQRHGVTLFMTLMSAWSLLLSRLSGQSDVVIGSPVANRTRAEIEGLIGMFVNTLALRIDTSGEPSVGAAGTGQGAHAGGAGASGSAVRASGGHRPAGAQSGAQPAVPDHAELGQQRRPDLALGDLS
jgi:arthrofactin-type cyclic lipopeptide synthetase C